MWIKINLGYKKRLMKLKYKLKINSLIILTKLEFKETTSVKYNKGKLNIDFN